MMARRKVEAKAADPEHGVQLEYARLSDLQRWPGNPKRHAHADIVASVRRFGFADPIGIDAGTQRIVEGHGRLAALEALKKQGAAPPAYIDVAHDGEWLVPVLVGLTFSSPDEARAYLLAHNEVTLRAGWDAVKLHAMLRDLSDVGALAGTGFSDADVGRLLREVAPPSTPLPEPGAQGIKTLVLSFDAPSYDRIVARLSALMVRWKLASHTEVFERVLNHFDPPAPPAKG